MAKGWDLEHLRHSNARLLGKAGAPYRTKSKAKPVGIGKLPTSCTMCDKIFSDMKRTTSVSRNADEFWKDNEDDIKQEIHNALEGKMRHPYDKTAQESADSYVEELLQDDEQNGVEATITIYEKGEESTILIGHYTIQDMEGTGYGGDFIPVYHKTDAWRGYYDVESKKWKQIHSDTALAYSEDAKELEKFNDDLLKQANAAGIPIARAVSPTSNVFSASVDYFVPNEHAAKVEAMAKNLAKKYRDEERFASTALTGANPSEQTPHDKMLVKAVKRMKATGESPEQAATAIIKETKRDEKL